LPGRFLVSFDLELGWGARGPLSKEKLRLVRGARELLPRLLELVREREIRVTWATTLALGHKDFDEARTFVLEREGPVALEQLFPRPEELRRWPEAYFFPEFVRELHAGSHPEGRDELGCHTYCHPLWSERPGHQPDLGREFRLSRALASQLGCSLETVVFPENRYSRGALEAARAAGLLGFRRDDFVSGLKRRGPLRVLAGRALRLGDAFGWVPGLRQNGRAMEGGLVAVAGQRFLRLDDPPWLRRAHIARVGRELQKALESGATYHVWSHPENFARAPKHALQAFASLLDQAVELRERGAAVSMTMAEVCRDDLSSEPSRASSLF
jgi:peptidoglycan/xylan/chitin deacetylase (PgdA/CDA1 family)